MPGPLESRQSRVFLPVLSSSWMLALSVVATPVLADGMFSIPARSVSAIDGGVVVAPADPVSRALLGEIPSGPPAGSMARELVMEKEPFVHSRLAFPLLLAPLIRELPAGVGDPAATVPSSGSAAASADGEAWLARAGVPGR